MVLMIDEVDSASNNRTFLDFLALIRGYYMSRDRKPTFQAVILAGVYDVKNLKRKIAADGESKMNSPWNIAADFLVEMSLLLFQGQNIIYNPDNHIIDLALMFGFVRTDGHSVQVANRIFETRLYYHLGKGRTLIEAVV